MILSIDPGGTTGIAYLMRGGTFGTREVPSGAEGMISWLDDALDTPDPHQEQVDAVVCETFVPRPGAKSTQLDALHIIGMLRYLCGREDIPLIMQSPAQAKSFATNDKLKAVGWYVVGEDHGRDAARHLLVYVVSKGRGGLVDTVLVDRILAALVAS